MSKEIQRILPLFEQVSVLASRMRSGDTAIFTDMRIFLSVFRNSDTEGELVARAIRKERRGYVHAEDLHAQKSFCEIGRDGK